ncbi:MAG: IPT/TIG domain-containing protein [Blastocatellia bacterium]
MPSSFLSHYFVLRLLLCFLCLSSLASAQGNSGSVTVVSAASFEARPVAPDSLVSAFGANLATATATATDVDATQPGVQLPIQLAGTSVLVNGRAAKLLFVSPGQVNFILPPETEEGFARIQIITGNGAASSGQAEVLPIFPALFTANADGQGALVANVVRVRNGVRLPDESLVQFDPTTKRFVNQPLDVGPESDRVFLEIYGTGIRGAGDPNNDGNMQENVWVLLGGQVITPTFAGRQPVYAGLDQVNFEIPRNLVGSGRLNLSLHVRRKNPGLADYTGYTARLVELVLADRQGNRPPTVRDVSPTTVQAGQTITITGEDFALTPGENIVKLGDAVASVEAASSTQLVARVPYGAASARVTVKTPNGFGTSTATVSLRTSISGYVELVDGAFYLGLTLRSPSVYALKNIAVRLVGTNLSARTNEDGVFQLNDVPPGVAYLEVDANITPVTSQFPKAKIQVTVEAGKDNLLLEPIRLQPSDGPGFSPDYPDARADLHVELAEGATVQYADGTTDRPLAVTRIWDLPKATPSLKLPESLLSPLVLLQVTPSDASFPDGAKLVIPSFAGIPPAALQWQVYRYDQTIGSPTFGSYVEIPGVAQTRDVPAGLEVPIKETGYYLLGLALQPFELPYSDPISPARLGRVFAADGTTPIPKALVFASPFLRGGQLTDEAGWYILRNTPFFDTALVQYLSPTGKVIRRTFAPATNTINQSAPAEMVPVEHPTSQIETGIVLLPSVMQMKVNEQRFENFLLLGASNIQQVAVTGAPFASLLANGAGSYSLSLKPKTSDFGDFRLTVSATDRQGQTYSRLVDVRVTASNSPPTITLPQLEYQVKVGETLSIPITATDADAGQTVSLYFGTELVAQGNPVNTTYTFTPVSTSIGTTFLDITAVDDGYRALRTRRTVVLRVVGNPQINDWTLISRSSLPGLVTDGAGYGVPTAFDGATIPHTYISSTLYSSVFGEGVFYSTNFGVTWTKANGLRVSPNVEYVGQVFGSDKLLLIEVGSTTTRRVYASFNQGHDWTLFQSYSGSQNVLAGDARGHLLVRDADGQLAQATLSGTTIKLTPTNLPANSEIKFIADAGTQLYLAVDRLDNSADRMLTSSDGGLNWTDATGTFPAGDYRTLHFVGNRVYARTDNGAWISTNNGASWNPLTGLADANTVVAFASNDKYVFALLSDGRVYAFPLA